MALEILEWPIIFLIKIPSLQFFPKLLPDIDNDTGRAKMQNSRIFFYNMGVSQTYFVLPCYSYISQITPLKGGRNKKIDYDL